MNTSPFNNMFAGCFKSLTDLAAFDPAKYSAAFDMDSTINRNKRHIESTSHANHLVMANMQALLKRQADILQDSTSRLLDCCKKIATLNNHEKIVEEQTNYIKESIAANLANTKELAEISTKAQIEMLDHLGGAMSETVNECCKPIVK